jgi:hypothetical protein
MSTPTATYKPGAYVIVRFGGDDGRQLAEIARVIDGGYMVRKFRAKSKRWTGMVAVNASEIVGPAAGSDLLRRAQAAGFALR